jgi:LysM repeat protein
MRSQPEVIVITATFKPEIQATDVSTNQPSAPIGQALSPIPGSPLSFPTPDPTRPASESALREYVVQSGDTLYGIALAHGMSLETIMSENSLPDPNQLTVGQTLVLPGPPDGQTSDFKIIPDGRLVRGPGAGAFDVFEFVAQMPGYIRLATDVVKEETLTGAEIVQQVSLEFSVDARLLLTVLEYRSGWLSNPSPSEEIKQYPLGIQEFAGVDRSGLYRQLTWAADQLNRGYYGWKYRGLTTLELEDGLRLMYSPGLNAGTVGVQYMLSQGTPFAAWEQQVEPDGIYATYVAYFGDPFSGSADPIVGSSLAARTEAGEAEVRGQQ